MGESAEALSIQVNGQRLVARTQGIDSHVKLLASDEQGVHDVALDNVWLGLGTLWLPSELVLPLGDVLKLIE